MCVNLRVRAALDDFVSPIVCGTTIGRYQISTHTCGPLRKWIDKSLGGWGDRNQIFTRLSKNVSVVVGVGDTECPAFSQTMQTLQLSAREGRWNSNLKARILLCLLSVQNQWEGKVCAGHLQTLSASFGVKDCFKQKTSHNILLHKHTPDFSKLSFKNSQNN